MKAVFYQLMQLVCSGILSLFFSISLNAQQNKMEAAGVYFLKGVMETASVFELKPDSSFEFFFSQGALDRGGKGK
ncbi:MAG: hypothetical protein ABJC98_07235, partial [Bacteroidota bacterium]